MVSQGIGRFHIAATVWLMDPCAEPQQGSEKLVEGGVGVSINVGVASFPLTTTSTSFEMGNLALTDVELEATSRRDGDRLLRSGATISLDSARTQFDTVVQEP